MLNVPVRTVSATALALVTILSLSACSKNAQTVQAAVTQASPFLLTASIQDIMHGEVDPAADLLWESVGTEVTAKGETHQQPRTAEEWNQVRNAAVTLVEATNLLVMDGRHVVGTGKEVEDAHVTGIRAAAEIEAAIQSDRATWVAFAHALHASGEQALQAADTHDPEKLLHAGEALDAVCEACHLKYWYPGQVIPKL